MLLKIAQPAAALLLLLAGAAGGQEAAAPPTNAAERDAQVIDVGELPDVVAVVNGQEITRDQLMSEAIGAYQQLRQIGRQPEIDREFLGQALDQIIAGMLLHEAARVEGVAATSEEVNQRVLQVRASFTTEEAFQQYLSRGGTTESTLREEMAREISRGKYLESRIVPTVTTSAQQRRAFYDENVERMRRPERVRVQHILIRPEADGEVTAAAKTEALRRAQALLAQARAGDDFSTLARESSADSSRDQGGELPWIVRGQTMPAFEEAAFALQPGQMSDIVETPLGYHILKGLDREDARTATFEEVEDRIDQVLKGQAAQVLLRQRVGDLMNQARIERFFS